MLSIIFGSHVSTQKIAKKRQTILFNCNWNLTTIKHTIAGIIVACSSQTLLFSSGPIDYILSQAFVTLMVMPLEALW